ncbi:hypothetical protein TrLO_g4020 [Triparma laevis f. longispina]|uniref:BZIP domain-containing protein n=1 Tax=Triparma laevis f. longispina TaxID=1714387 RepID=A0A9W7A3N7_9STRA|nr:hypothetical protein TrLO_g4020 [Triparma laevis f. longispina]
MSRQASNSDGGNPNAKRSATLGQWKTPPQQMFTANHMQHQAHVFAQQQQQQQVIDQGMVPSSSIGDLKSLESMNISPAPGYEQASSLPRSASLNDLTSKKSIDEEKRRKRLARNRASARLRRLRKKNLVESYESEVGVLEGSLKKLKQHTWGSSDPNLLTTALSMDRGSQILSADSRSTLIRGILEQELEHVENILDEQLDQLVLLELSQNASNPTNDPEKKKVFSELHGVLNLTQAQVQKLGASNAHKTRTQISTVALTISSLLSSPWLHNPGVETTIQKFVKILNPGQVQKFLLWVDNNSESVEKLNYVEANGNVQRGPVFYFGGEEMEEEEGKR